MTNDEMIEMLEAMTPEERRSLCVEIGIAAIGCEPITPEPKAAPSAKIRCKVCGFHKKPRKVLRDTGICGVCTEAVKDGDADGVEVIGRMGKRGRNSVSVVIDGKRYKVKRLSSRHSERIAAKYASKGKGYAKRAKRTGDAPKGLPTDSRIGADREQRTPDA
jgi:ribosomal protein S14